ALQPTAVETADDRLLAHLAKLGRLTGGEDLLVSQVLAVRLGRGHEPPPGGVRPAAAAGQTPGDGRYRRPSCPTSHRRPDIAEAVAACGDFPDGAWAQPLDPRFSILTLGSASRMW